MSKKLTDKELLGIIGIILGILVLIVLCCSILVYFYIGIYGVGIDYAPISWLNFKVRYVTRDEYNGVYRFNTEEWYAGI